MVEPFRICGIFYKIKLSKKGSPLKYAYPRVFLKSKHIGQIWQRQPFSFQGRSFLLVT